jgi:hypothetical protein
MVMKALVTKNEPGRICEIVAPGNEFEVHADFSWIDVPDDTTTQDTYNEDGTLSKFDIHSVPGFAENAYKVARGIGYGSIGDQLDLLFKEVMATGTISNTGPWATHIANIKSAIPKDDIQTVIAWNQQHWESIQGNV